MEESKKYIKENGIPSGEEIANMVGCGNVYRRAKKRMMQQRPTVENVIRINQTELNEIIKETVTKILKEKSHGF